MTSPIELGTLIKFIRMAATKAETVTSNRQACVCLTNSLCLIAQILQDIQSNYELNSEEQTKVDVLCKDLHDVTCRANHHFNRCQRHNLSAKVKNFLQASSIKDELVQLQTEYQMLIVTLNLILQVARSKMSENSNWHGRQQNSVDQRRPSTSLDFILPYANCDKWGEPIMDGIRYYCLECPEFDLCEECNLLPTISTSKGIHSKDHSMIQLHGLPFPSKD